MIDYAEFVLKLKSLQNQYHDCILHKDLEQALIVSDSILKTAKSINDFTKLCIETKSC